MAPPRRLRVMSRSGLLVARDSQSSLAAPVWWLLHRELGNIGKICVAAQTQRFHSITATSPEEWRQMDLIPIVELVPGIRPGYVKR
jgi:hypothetical protein